MVTTIRLIDDALALALHVVDRWGTTEATSPVVQSKIRALGLDNDLEAGLLDHWAGARQGTTRKPATIAFMLRRIAEAASRPFEINHRKRDKELRRTLGMVLDYLAKAGACQVDAGNAILDATLRLEDAGQGAGGPTGTPQKAIPRASDEAQGTARVMPRESRALAPGIVPPPRRQPAPVVGRPMDLLARGIFRGSKRVAAIGITCRTPRGGDTSQGLRQIPGSSRRPA